MTRARLPHLHILAFCVSCTGIPLYANAAAHASHNLPSEQPRLLAHMFDPMLIRGDGNVEFSNLLSYEDNSLLPGVYRFDVRLNNDIIGKRDAALYVPRNSNKVLICVTAPMLAEFGLKPDYIEALQRTADNDCVRITDLDSKASLDYDPGQMQLQISIPQEYLQVDKHGYVDQSLWDYGITAGFVNYQTSMRSDTHFGQNTKAYYLGMNSGLNIGGWRLRNESNLTKNNWSGTQLKSNRTYIQHDVSALQAQFSAGELYTNAEIFNSVRFRGIQLSSDDAMLADSERGYAPVVRGVAETYATVEVRQDGYLLTSVPVPPGPFALSNLYPNGSNGDLDVTIIEADGRQHSFKQAYASLPLMVRKGTLRYSAELGKTSLTNKSLSNLAFSSATAVYGLTDNITIAGGLQASSNYQAINLGLGGNTPLGAVSIDLTHSRSVAAGQTLQGQSIRALYSKTLIRTNTTFTLAAYRYSTQGFRSLENHIADTQQSRKSINHLPASLLPRSRMDLSINQQIGNSGQYGSLYLNATYENYWNQQRSNSISAGYGNNWGRVSYNISYGHSTTRTPYSASYNNHFIMLSLSIPLGSTRDSPSLYLSSMRAKQGTTATASMNGYVPGMEHTSYSLQTARSHNNEQSGSVAITSDLPLMRVSANYSRGRDYHSYGLNASGAIVAHAGGINVTREIGDSFAVIRVDGVKNVGLGNNLPTVGANSHIIYPYLQPYKLNTLRIDTSTLGADTEMQTLNQSVVPRRGAIVATTFSGYTGRRVQMQFTRENNRHLPMGAAVHDEENRQVGLIDNNGQALLLLRKDSGTLTVRWQQDSCHSQYHLTERDPKRYYDKTEVQCH